MARSGPTPALRASVTARAIGFAGLAIAGLLAGGVVAAALASVLYLAVMTASSLQRSPLPRIAALLSTSGAAEANGLTGAAGAGGALVGSLAAGLIADVFSYEAVLWVAGSAALVAVPFLGVIARAVGRVRGAGQSSERA